MKLISAYLVKRGGVWAVRYREPGETTYRTQSLGVGDKRVAEEKLTVFRREKEQEAAGLIAPQPIRTAATVPLLTHLGDFIAELRTTGRAAKYIYNVEHHLTRLMDECGWKLPKDVTAESFMAWRRRQRLNAKTLNDYFAEMKGFLRWMERQDRLVVNPLQRVEKIKRPDMDSPIRALSMEELTALLAVSPERRPIYLLAVTTGLRRNEIDELRWSDVHLDAAHPYLAVRGSTTKNRKSVTIPLHEDAVAELKSLKSRRNNSGGAVFPEKVPDMATFRADLKAAGIREEDDSGRRVIFHSLRHTTATLLAQVGVAARVAQELMRHSDPKLTHRLYTDASQLPTRAAVNRLPTFALVRQNDCTENCTHDLGTAGQNGALPDPSCHSAENEKPSEKSEGFHEFLPESNRNPEMRHVGLEPTTR